MKKCFAVVLTAALLLCAAPLAGFTAIDWPELDFGSLFPTAKAAEIIAGGTCGEGYTTDGGYGSNLTWTESSDGVLTISGTGKMWNFMGDGQPWFDPEPSIPGTWRNETSEHLITTVIIEEGVTSIGEDAFYNTSFGYSAGKAIAHVEFPDSLEAIGSGAFEDTKWDKNQPKGLVYAGKVAYQYKGTMPEDTTIVLEEGTKGIAGAAFVNCAGLSQIELPDSLTNIGEAAFLRCENLTSVTIPAGVTYIGLTAFDRCTRLASVTFPDSMTGDLTIEEFVFYGCENLTSVTLPAGVTQIPLGTFGECKKLKSITIPDSVERISYGAVSECPALSVINYAGSAEQWAQIKFYEPEYYEVWYDEDEGENHSWLLDSSIRFNYKPAEELKTKSLKGVVREGDGWAIWWKITYQENKKGKRLNPELSIFMTGKDKSGSSFYCRDNNDSDISPWLANTDFDKTEFENLSIKGTAKNNIIIPPDLFEGYTGLTEVTIRYIDGIKDAAFQNCTSLEIIYGFDEHLGSIGDCAFQWCTSLKTVKARFGSIGESAFEGCVSLNSLNIYGLKTNIGKNAFKGCKKVTLCVDDGSKAEKYASKNKIKYILRDVATVFYEHDGYSYEARFSPLLFNESSAKYNKDLAMLSGMLSWEAEHFDYEKGATSRPLYQDLGIILGDINNNFVDRDSFISDEIFKTKFGGVSFCSTVALKKIIIDEEETNLLIIVGRGTQTAREGWNDGTAMAKSAFFNYTKFKAYDMVYNYEQIVMGQLKDFCSYYPDLKKQPLKILVTGHSLGGALANLAGAHLTLFADEGEWWSKLVDKDDIYVYTFGALDSINTNGTVPNGYENIHNIMNFYDTFGPHGSLSTLVNHQSTYGKFGHLDMFHPAKNDSLLGTGEAHEMHTYLSAVYSGQVKNENKADQRIVSFRCPVDVKIYRDGELVGQVTDNKVVDSVTTIPISVVDDEKYALLEGDGAYTFEMTGTDTGTMTYTIADAITGETQQQFENVALETGKTMRSAVGPETAAEEIRLFVVNDKGVATAEIAPDGTETEVEPAYTLGDVNNDGKVGSDDARLALRASVGLEDYVAGSAAFLAADVNKDGKIGSDDARTILRVSVKLEAFA